MRGTATLPNVDDNSRYNKTARASKATATLSRVVLCLPDKKQNISESTCQCPGKSKNCRTTDQKKKVKPKRFHTRVDCIK